MKVPLYLICLLALLVGFLCVAGCGGGTSGTDGGTSARRLSVSGTLTSADAAPLEGILVTLAETDAQTRTSGSGTFALSGRLSGESATLLIQASGLDASVTLSDLPDRDVDVRVAIIADAETNNVSLVGYVIIDDGSSVLTPTPTATPAPTSAVVLPTAIPTEPPAAATPTASSVTRIQGQVVDYLLRPIGNARVIVSATGASGSTNQAGRFQLVSPLVSGNVLLRLTLNGRNLGTVVIPAVPNRAVTIVVLIKVNGLTRRSGSDPGGHQNLEVRPIPGQGRVSASVESVRFE